jgi:hypothetical protein
MPGDVFQCLIDKDFPTVGVEQILQRQLRQPAEHRVVAQVRFDELIDRIRIAKCPGSTRSHDWIQLAPQCRQELVIQNAGIRLNRDDRAHPRAALRAAARRSPPSLSRRRRSHIPARR